ncbi:MAG: sulfite exporter TauE/SafE family protein [Limnothrix sp.]|nr:sulfite exporter TauE/SafE family protein [Limnothrix sp.]
MDSLIWAIGHGLAVVIGIALGLLGGGGSVLALPILTSVMGVPVKPAIAMTLAIVGTVSLLGVIPHWRAGRVRWRVAAIFGLSTAIGAFGGAKLATQPWVTPPIQMMLFVGMMLLAAIATIRRSSTPAPTDRSPESALAAYPQPVCRYCWLWLLTEGIGVGMLTGLVGVGGGFAIVPALVLLGNVPMKQAIGTSLVIIAANSIAGLAGYAGHVAINWPLTVSFTGAAALGTLPGAYLSKWVPADRLQRWFGYFLLAIASLVFLQNYRTLLGPNPQTQQPPTRPLSQLNRSHHPQPASRQTFARSARLRS